MTYFLSPSPSRLWCVRSGRIRLDEKSVADWTDHETPKMKSGVDPDPNHDPPPYLRPLKRSKL